MAQRRMLSIEIVGSDAFMDMPATSQLLYFHLCMRADDEGFIGNPKIVMKLVGSTDDDIKILLSKRFVLPFDSGVLLIKHWLIHNLIRMNRFKESTYLEEKEKIYLKNNKAYTDDKQLGRPLAGLWPTEVKLSKVKLSKDKIRKTTEQSSDSIKKIEEPYILKKYLEKMKEDKKSHIRLIGYYVERKELTPDSLNEMSLIIRRFSPIAVQISKTYSKEKITKAFNLVIEKHSDIDWGLETVYKKLTNTNL